MARVYYDYDSHTDNPDAYASTAETSSVPIPGLEGKRYVHTASLTGLETGRVVYFMVGGTDIGFSQEYRFRTIPREGPLRFVEGGDMGYYPETRALLEEAAKRDPQFAVVGGDIAYANADLENTDRWDAWFTNWSELMHTADGCLVPIIAIIGNHEINYDAPDDFSLRAPFYMTFFGGQGEHTYFARRFDQGVAFYLLDSGHLVKHEAQAGWLRAAMSADADLPWKFPVYHKPVYPATRDFEGEGATLGQKFWVPSFDEFHATVAFEHHGHMFKRTVPLRGGQPAEGGTVYLGEGCWGNVPRGLGHERAPYVDALVSRRYFNCVEVTSDSVVVNAIGEDGEAFDTWTVARQPEAAAEMSE